MEEIFVINVKPIIQELIQLIRYLHSKGIVHNDIKPNNNIIIKPDNSISLIDFDHSFTIDGCYPPAPFLIEEGYDIIYQTDIDKLVIMLYMYLFKVSYEDAYDYIYDDNTKGDFRRGLTFNDIEILFQKY